MVLVKRRLTVWILLRSTESEATESSQQVVQTQQAHASEISLRITALETDFTPLFGDSAGERRVRTQLLPQLQHTDTAQYSDVTASAGEGGLLQKPR